MRLLSSLCASCSSALMSPAVMMSVVSSAYV